jgi:hypothetical protein
MKTFKEFMSEGRFDPIKGSPGTWYLKVRNPTLSGRGATIEWPTQNTPKTGTLIKYSMDNLIDPGGIHPASELPGGAFSVQRGGGVNNFLRRIKEEGFKKIAVNMQMSNPPQFIYDLFDKVKAKSGVEIVITGKKQKVK